MSDKAKDMIISLRNTCQTAYLASVNADGYPFVRAMLVLEHDSLETQYFSTNTSSSKVNQFQNNPKASVYYCSPGEFQGALFVGDIEVCTDQKTKDFLWREGFERYYPKGVTDPDYCVLKLTVKYASCYAALSGAKYTIEELLS